MIQASNYDDNCFKLTGMIETREFNKGLKEIYLKIMIYNFHNWSSENQGNFLNTIENFHIEISQDVDISEMLDIFPENWYEFIHKNEILDAKNKEIEEPCVKITHEGSPNANPELKKSQEEDINKIKLKKKDEENGILFLLDDLENIGLMKSEFYGKKQKINEQKTNEQKLIDQHKEIKKTTSDKVKDVLIYFFANSLNQRSKHLEDRLNEETIYKLFKDGGLLNNRNWGKILTEKDLNKSIVLCQKAFRVALKIALEIYAIEGHLRSNIEETEKQWFIGNRNSDELFQAITQKKNNLMCLIYDFSKKETNVLRATSNQMQGYV